MGRGTYSQPDRFIPHRFVNINNLTQQCPITIQFSRSCGGIHSQPVQSKFKLIKRENGSSWDDLIVFE